MIRFAGAGDLWRGLGTCSTVNSDTAALTESSPSAHYITSLSLAHAHAHAHSQTQRLNDGAVRQFMAVSLRWSLTGSLRSPSEAMTAMLKSNTLNGVKLKKQNRVNIFELRRLPSSLIYTEWKLGHYECSMI